MQFTTVIGLEIHAQLATKSKIFSGASTKFGATPNTQACLIDLGMPGVLPVLNQKAVEMAVMFGAAIKAEIADKSVFARKNYFYPDLPSGYQISQFELPVVGKGQVEIDLADGSSKTIGVTRAHLEQDAGKSLHEEYSDMSGIDLNRSGTPLLEIVSEPDLRSASEAVAYARKIYSLVKCLGVCDGNMQEGSFRMDVNISLKPEGQKEFGTRTEIKNLNSFRFMEKAIAFEQQRQGIILQDGGRVIQETRLYDVNSGTTRSMRSKEESHDYRYFPDPDLLPLKLEDAYIDDIKRKLPELPDQKKHRFMHDFKLDNYQAIVLTASVEQADYFEQAYKISEDAALTANWVMGELAAFLNKDAIEIDKSPVSAKMLGELISRIKDKTISGKIAKSVFEAMWQGKGSADDIIEAKGLKQITDTGAIETMIDKVIADNPNQVMQYKAGKDKLLGYFVGQVMKESKGKANPAELNRLLKEKLS